MGVNWRLIFLVDNECDLCISMKIPCRVAACSRPTYLRRLNRVSITEDELEGKHLVLV